jgi:hypothetical protein
MGVPSISTLTIIFFAFYEESYIIRISIVKWRTHTMALMHNAGHDQIGSPEMGGAVAPVIPINPRENGGFSLPEYQTEVDADYKKAIATVHHPFLGTTWVDEWRMDDGTRFDVSLSEPLSHTSDIVVVKDTAWGTQVRGFNEDVARMFMRMGLTLLIKGPEKNRSIPLSHSAHNTHKVLDVAQDLGYHRPDIAMVEGYSRGAMIGLGTNAYASQFGRRILYSELTDPCVARPLSELSRKEWVELMKDAPPEIATGIYQLGHLALNPVKAWHYRRTINASPAGLLQFVRHAKPVFSGETGDFARRFPEDGQANISFFMNSLASDEKTFRSILRDHYGVEINRLGRGHLTGMDTRLFGHIVSRFSGITKQLREGVEPEDVDYSFVHKKSKD